MEILSKLFENSEIVDVDELVALNNQIKAPLIEKFEKKEANLKTSLVWYESGLYLKKLESFRSAEVCFFMSHIYNKTDPQALKEFILVLAENFKYKLSIELLPRLHKICLEEDVTLFWETLTSIIPHELLSNEVQNADTCDLDALIEKLGMDGSNPMTWLCLGYTLKFFDFPILASQALDNSVALKSLQLHSEEFQNKI